MNKNIRKLKKYITNRVERFGGVSVRLGGKNDEGWLAKKLAREMGIKYTTEGFGYYRLYK